MTLAKSILHFIVASVVGLFMGVLLVACLSSLPSKIEKLLHLFELSFVVGSFVGGVTLGLNARLPRSLGAWLGCVVALGLIFWQAFGIVLASLRFNVSELQLLHLLLRALLMWFVAFSACAMAGYYGQLWVGKRGRGEKKVLLTTPVSE